MKMIQEPLNLFVVVLRICLLVEITLQVNDTFAGERYLQSHKL